MDLGRFRTLVKSASDFDTLVAMNVVSYTRGVAEFQLEALRWYFATQGA